MREESLSLKQDGSARAHWARKGLRSYPIHPGACKRNRRRDLLFFSTPPNGRRRLNPLLDPALGG